MVMNITINLLYCSKYHPIGAAIVLLSFKNRFIIEVCVQAWSVYECSWGIARFWDELFMGGYS